MFGLPIRTKRSTRRTVQASARPRRFRPALEALEALVLPSTFTVTTVADNGSNFNPTPGSLRSAILQSNATGPGPNLINFQIPSGSLTIQPPSQSALPPITIPVTIDGSSQAGFTGTPIIVLDGSLAGAAASGLTVNGSNSIIKGLVIDNFAQDGILIQGNNNWVQGCYIGVDVTGAVPAPNGQFGVVVAGTSQANVIGTNGDGTNDLAERNIISGNGLSGVAISGSQDVANVVAGNLIGTDVTGTAPVGNQGFGVMIGSGAQSNRIGVNDTDVGAASELNIISANALGGVSIGDTGTSQNLVAGNYIGTDISGLHTLANIHAGLTISNFASGNIIGTSELTGESPDQANVISGNDWSGIEITSASNNRVSGNKIGTDVTGTAMIPNLQQGVALFSGAPSNIIGTNGDGNGDAFEGNIISGNSLNGIFISDPNTNKNVVHGNLIGTDFSGTIALPNKHDGVAILGSAKQNLVGVNPADADPTLERNVISGNANNGVRIEDSGTNSNIIAGNAIGTDITGSVALGNAREGVDIFNGAQQNQIGTSPSNPNPLEGNLISANEGGGIFITDTPTNFNVIAANNIGLNASGTAALPNVGIGVQLISGASFNVVGGSAAMANIIADNTAQGVTVQNSNSLGNQIRGNSIFGNSFGIDLGGDGVTPNHSGGAISGPNNFQNYPVLTSAAPGATTVVTGTLNSGASATFTIDFYANAAPDASGHGQGQTYLGSTTVTTDGSGNASFQATLATATTPGEWISATATDSAGDTSEFSTDILSGPAPAHYVLNAAGSVTAGTSTSVTVTVEDGSGNTAVGYLGTIHFTSTDSQAVLPTDYTFTTSDQGVHTFSVTLKTAGSQTVNAADQGNPAVNGSTTIDVSASTTTGFSVQAPASATAGTPFDVTLAATDAYGNPTSSYTGTAHFTSSDTNAVLPSDFTFVGSDNGVHTFAGVVLGTAGSQTITATDVNNAAFTGTAHVAVSAGDVTQFVVIAPGGRVAGTPFAMTVMAEDALGNVNTGYAGTVTVTSSDAQAVLPPDYMFGTADHGVHTFTNVILKTVGNQTITATDTGAPSLTGSATVSIVAAPASHFAIAGPTAVGAGSPFTITVTAQDPYGNQATSYLGAVTFSSSDTSAVLPHTYTFGLADQGAHVFAAGVTLFAAGDQTVTATDSAHGISGNIAVTVSSASATHFVVQTSSQNIQPATPITVTVLAEDPYGNVDSDYAGTVHFTSSDVQATLPADYGFVAGDMGVHTFTDGVTLRTIGTQTVTATDSVNSGITGSAQVGVNTILATHFGVTAPAGSTAGTSFVVTVQALDGMGNVSADYTGTVHLTSTDPQAGLPADYTFTSTDQGVHSFTVTLKTAGAQTVTAGDVANGLTGSAPVAVDPAAASQLLVTTEGQSGTGGTFQSPSGSALTFVVTAEDPYGNVATGYAGTVHFTTTDTDPGVVLPADYTFTGADQGVHTFSNGAILKTVGAQTITATDAAGNLQGSLPITVTTGEVAVSTVYVGTLELVYVVYPNTQLYLFRSDNPTPQLLATGVLSVNAFTEPDGSVGTTVVYADHELFLFDTAHPTGESFGGFVLASSTSFNKEGAGITVVVYQDNSVYQFDSTGAHQVATTNNVAGVSLAFDAMDQEVLDVVYTDAAHSLYQFDSAGTHLEDTGVLWNYLTFDTNGQQVQERIYANLDLYQIDVTGKHLVTNLAP